MRRKAILGSVLALVATATTVPLVMPGTASAQTNARLCGRYWHGVHPKTGEQEVVAHFYEVDKGEGDTCEYAMATHVEDGFGNVVDEFNPTNSPFRNDILRSLILEVKTERFSQVRCEDWKNRPLNEGGLGGLPLVFSGDNFPETKDQDDICNNLNRSESLLSMESYWTHWIIREETVGLRPPAPGDFVTIVRGKN